MVDLKYPLLLLGKSSPKVAAAGFISHYRCGPKQAINNIYYTKNNRGCGTCYPVCEILHITYPMLLLEKGSPNVKDAGFLSHYMCGPKQAINNKY